eukprot:2824124-Amphidinium_carterae.1
MMQYKPQVAIEMSRSEYLLCLRSIRKECEAGDAMAAQQRMSLPLSDVFAPPPSGGEAIPSGTVFEDLDEADLWGATALKAFTDEASKPLAQKRGDRQNKK